MHYAQIALTFTQSEAFKKATLVQRGAWLSLYMHCISQENDGIIENCKNWTDFRCRSVLEINKRTLLTTSPLWAWHKNNLHIIGYPHSSQANLRKKRAETSPLELSAAYRTFETRLLTLRKKWASTKLTFDEYQAFQTTFAQISTPLTTEQWQLLTDYMDATTKFQKNGNKFYRPYTRKLMAEKLFQVLDLAQLWARENRKKAKPPTEHTTQTYPVSDHPDDQPLSYDEQFSMLEQIKN